MEIGWEDKQNRSIRILKNLYDLNLQRINEKKKIDFHIIVYIILFVIKKY